MTPTRALVRIRGRVQGVSFRYFTQQTARALGVSGWVRNLAGGDVEAVFEGGQAVVRQAIEACRQGPPAARVDEVQVIREEYRGEFPGFEVRR